MRVQFLWWEGCPSHPEAWQRLHDVLAGLDVHAEVERIEIKTDDDAERWRFPGSPTILIDGQDIAPQAEPVYRLTCRLYFREDGRPSPLPSEATIRRAVQQALARCQDQV
ncbi:MAG: hypothetical protein GXY36_07350 [Chloroflexi bacterium]|nr:hypothetical protein [Chloroflexota bacterium]